MPGVVAVIVLFFVAVAVIVTMTVMFYVTKRMMRRMIGEEIKKIREEVATQLEESFPHVTVRKVESWQGSGKTQIRLKTPKHEQYVK